MHIWGHWYFSWQSWLQLFLHPTEHFMSCTLHMINKKGDNITALMYYSFDVFETNPLFHVWFFSSWPAYRFLRRQVRCSIILISWRILQFVVIHTVKGFDFVNKADVHIFLVFSCFFYDLMFVSNLISGSLPFLNPAWTSRSSRFTYSWSMPWRI